MNTIQVKCYLQTASFNGNETFNEIRRFDLEANQAASIGLFEQLFTKSLTAYRQYLKEGDKIKFCWEDEDREHVGFSNDVELEYAIDYQKKVKKKRRLCFLTSNPVINLKVFIITDTSNPLNRTSISFGNQTKSKSKSLINMDEISKMKKTIKKEFNHIREHNINLLKPGYKSSEANTHNSYTRASTIHTSTPDFLAPEEEKIKEKKIEEKINEDLNENINDETLDDNTDNMSITADDISQAMDSFKLSTLEIGSIKSKEVDIQNEKLREEIELVKNSDLDPEEKADKILKINVKYYISNLLDSVINENSDLAIPAGKSLFLEESCK